MIIGIDVGNATTITSEGIIFDSKLTNIEPLNECDCIVIDNKKYYIGEGDFDTTYRKVNKESYVTLMYSALALSSKDTHNNVVLGLPLSQYKEDKNTLINKVMKESNKEIILNGNAKKIIIDDVEVFPEAIVTLEDDYEGIVIDIGGRTTDAALVENYRGKRKVINPISIPAGTINLYGDFINLLNGRFSLDLKLQDAERILKNGLLLDGKLQCIDFAIEVFQRFVTDLINRLQIEYSLRTNRISLTGGGAELFGETLKSRLGDGVQIQEDGLYANANNFCELGCSIWQ